MVIKDNLNNLTNCITDKVDVFICCCSYEDRCLSISKNLNKDYIAKAIILNDINVKTYSEKNRELMLKEFGEKAISIEVNSSDPIFTADNVLEEVKKSKEISSCQYLIDITTFTHEFLLILIKILQIYKNADDTIKFVYNSASDYSVGNDIDNKWLSKGIAEVRSVLGYPGVILPSRKLQLIILVGYEHERAAKLIEAFEPNQIVLGYGKAGTETGNQHHEANKHFYKLVTNVATTYGNVEHFEFSCNDPIEAKKAIIEQVAKDSNFNNILVPMNTKISTIGCALAAKENDELQVCYGQAMYYNYQNYSTSGDNFYLFTLEELFKE